MEIGVVAFKVENGEEIVRYNPSPDYFESWVGSLKDAENSEPITPSEMEQFEQELQNGLNQVANVDIDAKKVENVATVTITNRYGEEKRVSIYDGEKGDKGDKGDKGEQGIQGIQGEKGDTGNGISSITKTSTSGLVDTYTITFTNGQTTTYQITNGENGSVVDVQVDGTSVVDNGIANIVGISEIKQELEDMYNLLPKVSGTGETITLDGTVVGKMLIDLKGNTNQEGTPTPESPQDIHVVSGDNTITVSNSDNTQSQSYPINLGDIELCKIGDYQDRIYKDNGKWFLHKEIEKVVFDGSESWAINTSYTYNVFYRTLDNYARISNTQTTYCEYYKGIENTAGIVDFGNNYNNSIGVRTANDNIKDIYISNNSITSASDFKNWLSTHNTVVYYVLATPTYTEITDSALISQLEALNGARSYTTQTNISQVNNDKPFILDVTALKQLTTEEI